MGAAVAEGARSPLLSSVRNAARVLRAFSHADQELGVTELSRRLGLGKSTTHRLVTTLEAERLLEQDPGGVAHRRQQRRPRAFRHCRPPTAHRVAPVPLRGTVCRTG